MLVFFWDLKFVNLDNLIMFYGTKMPSSTKNVMVEIEFQIKQGILFSLELIIHF